MTICCLFGQHKKQISPTIVLYCKQNFKSHMNYPSSKISVLYKYSKTCLKWPLSKRPKIVFQDQLSFNASQKYCNAECSKGSILQYFLPLLSYHVSLRPLFCLILSGHLRQVSLYDDNQYTCCGNSVIRYCANFCS